MSIGLRSGTSVSSISFRSVVWTPRPLTSRPAILMEAAILSITVRLLYEIADQIFYITADITGLAELCSIRFDERHTDQIGDVFD